MELTKNTKPYVEPIIRMLPISEEDFLRTSLEMVDSSQGDSWKWVDISW